MIYNDDDDDLLLLEEKKHIVLIDTIHDFYHRCCVVDFRVGDVILIFRMWLAHI